MRQLVNEKENSEFKPVKLRLKIDLVSSPAWVEALVNMAIGETYLIYDNWKSFVHGDKIDLLYDYGKSFIL